jgi:acetyltransferase-like isoleucine patch superfamily enzyme
MIGVREEVIGDLSGGATPPEVAAKIARAYRSRMELRSRVRDPRVSVGRGTYGSPRFLLFTADDRIEIGRYCSIAEDVHILGGGEKDHQRVTTFPLHFFHGDDPGAMVSDPTQIRYRSRYSKGPTRIGSDVWIGHGATVLSGVRIGHGAVIGAAAVVASDVSPYAVVVGNPGRCVKKRFDDALIERLLDIHWWDWRVEVVYRLQDDLYGSPGPLFEYLERLSPEELASLYETGPVSDAYQFDDTPAGGRHAAKKLVRELTPPMVYDWLARAYRALAGRLS